VHDEASFKVGVRGEHFSGVDFLHFEGPGVKHDDLLSEIKDTNVGELLLEFSQCFLGEISGYEEVTISNEEMGECLLDVALDGFLEGLVDFAEVTTNVE
jgi:hypothetical protein